MIRIRNINTYAQIGFLLVAGAMTVAIIGTLTLYRYKKSKNDMPLKSKSSIILGTVFYATILGITELNIALVLLSYWHN